MNILRLQFEALGPFSAKQDIDFSTGNRAGLFLINGPTGSGKTSILDALCFALYGASSGDERKAADLRSHHVGEDVQTSVSLEFALQDKVYRIRRWMSARRVQAFSEKAVIEEIAPESRIIADKRTDANLAIQNLLHLDASQFRQVIVLPQGRFRDFLVSSSQERERILQNLFATSRLDDFVIRMGELRQTQSDALAKVHAKVEFLQAQLRVTPERTALSRVQEIGSLLAAATQAREELRAKVQAARQELAQGQADLRQFQALSAAADDCDRLEAELPSREHQQTQLQQSKSLSAISHLHETARTARQELDRLGHERQRLEAESARTVANLSELETQFAESLNLLAGIPERQARLARHQAMGNALADLEKLQSQSKEYSQQTRQASVELSRLEGFWSEQQAKLIHLQEERSRDQAWAQSAAWLESLVNQLDRIHDAWLELVETGKLRNELAGGIHRLQAASLQAAAEAHEYRQRLAHHLHETERSSAVGLATQLRPGEPCPVCGSREHPEPATPVTADTGALKSPPLDGGLELAQLEFRISELSAHQNDLQVQEQVKLAQENQAASDRSRALARIRDLLGSGIFKEPGLEIPAALSSWWPEAQAFPASFDADSGNWPQLALAREAVSTHARTSLAAQRSVIMLDKQLAALRLNQTTQEIALRNAREQAAIASERETGMAARIDEERSRLSRIWGHGNQDLPNPADLATLVAGDHVLIQRIEQDHRDLDTRLAGLRQHRAITEARLQDLAKRQDILSAEQRKSESAWEEARQKAGFSDTAQALASLMPAPSQAILEMALRDYQAALLAARSRRDELRGLLTGKQALELGQLTIALQAHEQELQTSETACASLDHQHVQALSQSAELLQAGEDMTGGQQALDSLTALHRLLNGQEASGAYVNLQRYALSVFLDEILLIANQHLREMSRSRYQLVRDDQTTGKRRTGGLELYVADIVTGIRRGTESLSGGESFMTALSLALGLSSVVHARSGGVRLDTLFVDEGFGSLDEDSLEDAMRVLGRIHEKGRVIGIISHVRELRERISCRLVVSKGPSGSVVAWAD